MLSKKILIITGGNIDIEWAREWIRTQAFSYIIAADSGLRYAYELGCRVDLLLGDYDSVDKAFLERYKDTAGEMITFPKEKDYTDTQLALETALEKGAEEIIIIGGTGARLDHTMCTVFNMVLALQSGVPCYLLDKNNKIYLINSNISIEKKSQYGKYISILPFTEKVEGITLKGFFYPLTDFCMTKGQSIGISNEIIQETAVIELKNGILTVFETHD